jgi:hypothetical protein
MFEAIIDTYYHLEVKISLTPYFTTNSNLASFSPPRGKEGPGDTPGAPAKEKDSLWNLLTPCSPAREVLGLHI